MLGEQRVTDIGDAGRPDPTVRSRRRLLVARSMDSPLASAVAPAAHKATGLRRLKTITERAVQIR